MTPRAGMTMLRAALACLPLLAGCGESEGEKLNRREVDLSKVPAPVIASARKSLPGVNFSEAWTNHRAGEEAVHSYEIKGRTASNGKIREVRVGPDGAILETE